MFKGFKVWIKMRDSFWFVPTVYSVVSLVLVVLLHQVDEWLLRYQKEELPNLLIIDDNIARGLYTSLVTAILTMTTISFSVIMVVLTTYSSQFSQRTLQDFMQSRITHHILGVFCFGFIFALVNLIVLGAHDTVSGPVLMVIIAVVSLGFFIYFIHHASRWLQVSRLVDFIHVDSTRVIENLKQKKKYGEHEAWDDKEIEEIKTVVYDVHATASGYIQKIDWLFLVNWAKKNGCIIEIPYHIGAYVTKHLPMLKIYQLKSQEQCEGLDSIHECIIIGNERTDLEDIEFNIQKLVEIAIKAVSPSVNDPDTAISCINRIGSILGELGRDFKEVRYLTDENEQLRVIKQAHSYEEYLYKSFQQIIFYGREDVSVGYSILDVLYKITLIIENWTIIRKIWAFHYHIINVFDMESMNELDRKHMEAIYRKLREACGK
ncbi:Uncharacterized membrane protein [Oceanobacillus limi]|uniref:Uncharacterized membrane protein n=1 Tax=Oceanobacillus limi TaxID=930131 RepID=A0A1I0CCC1_9BACI|nr:DUF2254 domain-containing protein [Oceanobacillus limi]SET16650.1 Uncharacterized membrane protein [Oceanobacillus limi]